MNKFIILTAFFSISNASQTALDIANVFINAGIRYDFTTKRVSGDVKIIKDGIDYPLRMKKIILTDGKQLFESSLNLQGRFQFMEKLRQGRYELVVKADNCEARKEILITTKSKMENIRLTCNPNK